MAWAGFCFCLCCSQHTGHRSIPLIFAHVAQALDMMAYFPFSFCSVISWGDMLEVRATCHWTLENAAMYFPGVIDLAGNEHKASVGRDVWGPGWRWALPAAHTLAQLCSVAVPWTCLTSNRELRLKQSIIALSICKLPTSQITHFCQQFRTVIPASIALPTALRFTSFEQARRGNKAFLHGWLPLENSSLPPGWKKTANVHFPPRN